MSHTDVVKAYVSEVKSCEFQDEDQYCYHMFEGKEEKSKNLMG